MLGGYIGVVVGLEITISTTGTRFGVWRLWVLRHGVQEPD